VLLVQMPPAPTVSRLYVAARNHKRPDAQSRVVSDAD
jgi:hypothetical protein